MYMQINAPVAECEEPTSPARQYPGTWWTNLLEYLQAPDLYDRQSLNPGPEWLECMNSNLW